MNTIPTPSKTFADILADGQAAIAAEEAAQQAAEEAVKARQQTVCDLVLSIAKGHIPEALHPYMQTRMDSAGRVVVRLFTPDALPVSVRFENTETEYDLEHAALLNPEKWQVDVNRWHQEIYIWDEEVDYMRFTGSFSDLPKAMALAVKFHRPEPKPEPETPQPARTLYDKLRGEIEIAAEHFDHGRAELGHQRSILTLTKTLVDIAETLDLTAI